MRFAPLLCTILLVLAGVGLRGQHTFNQRFFYPGGNNKPASLFVTDGLIHNYGMYRLGGQRYLISWTHDFSGECLDTLMILGDWGPSGVLPTSDGMSEDERHIQCGGQVDTAGVVGGFYQTFSSTGEPERFRAFRNPWWSGDPSDIVTAQAVPLDSYLTAAGDVLVAYGGQSVINASVDCGVICFGADDAYRWHLQFTGPWPERIHAITKVGDFFYFALERWNDDYVVNNDILVYKVNMSGEIVDEWLEPWPMNVTDVNEALADGNDLIFVGASVDVFTNPSDAFIMKVDSAMNVIWSSFIDNESEDFRRQFEDVTITTDGHYVAAGQYPYLLDEEDPKHGDRMDDVWLAKFNAQTGELMWERFYRIVVSTDKWHELFDLKATPDGGLAFVGESADFSDISSDENPLQQGWLVKTDQYGCIVPGCQGATPEPEDSTAVVLPEGEFFRFGPNPLTAGQPLNLFNGDIPEGANYEMHSSDGRLIARISAGYAGLSTQWYVPNLAAGSYILSLRHNGRTLQWARLVVG